MLTLPQTTTYLAYYDDSPKRTQADKIRAADDAYARRFGRAPTTALVALSEVVTVEGLSVRGETRIRPNNIHVGEG